MRYAEKDSLLTTNGFVAIVILLATPSDIQAQMNAYEVKTACV